MQPDDDFDPYDPPDASLDDPDPSGPLDDAPASALLVHKMYSPKQVLGATFFGSVLAGAWLMAKNYTAMGQDDKFGVTLAGGVGALVMVLGLSWIVPEELPGMTISLPVAFGAFAMAKSLQGDAFERHQMEGGQKHSNWRVAGICVVALIITMAIIFGAVLVVPVGV